ncbi:hypothetical protein Rsub_05705 [Raphidocelis subcapitata]|uniref:Chromo domain-containing protein n=1 Tax=Raphidocelis subcapitata TaxID=307507 RepID=A0A2V0NZN9_9CHLO|nr:hypothetical protein Rsub_05705 [Raphidocelis subcapitata]|eukprot:GBF93094.1 hypothetical protein Rsub_05705 [Raphidocelis subcapitata]
MASDAGPFSVGQSVLVPHTDKFYEAKVLKSGKREDGQWHYLIHYIGWNKKWDEWVEASGLQPATDAATLGLMQQPAKKAKGGSAGGATAAAAAAAWQRGKASHDGGAAAAGERAPHISCAPLGILFGLRSAANVGLRS